MTWRPGAIAAARVLNALFFLAVAAYCFLAYSPFAYEQFIKPNTVPALTDFVTVSPWLFWAALLMTVLTFMPQLRNRPWQLGPWTYIGTAVLAGIVIIARPPLGRVGHGTNALALGLVALVWPIWLAVVDHHIWPAPNLRRVESMRLLKACAASAVIACGTYAIAVPWRLSQALGVDIPRRLLAAAIASSLVAHLFVFIALFLAVVVAVGAARLISDHASLEFWSIVALFAAGATLVLYLLVCAAIAFTGRDAWICSAAMASAIAAAWADVARLRSHGTITYDPVALFAASVTGRGTRAGVLLSGAVLPLLAYALVESVRQFDWNFLLQKLSVLLVWLLAFAVAHAMIRESRRDVAPAWSAAAALIVLALYRVSLSAAPISLVDRYAAVDPSFRTIRDARVTLSSETADYYAYLRSHTLLAPGQIHSRGLDFVEGLVPTAARRPHIFLIVVDSLRRDYLSPYNPHVTFTPAIEALAADSFVFERAFSRYAGTALAIPSIWAGGMVPHTLSVVEFMRRNPLLKLLEANGYRRILTLDHIVAEFLAPDARVEELDQGKKTMEVDLCATFDELEHRLSSHRTQPVFFYSLPQNIHLAVAPKRRVPAGETYPPLFYDRIASSVHRIDACLGQFVDYLKHENLYDDSVIVLTSDHGDSLGEEGRWGHAYFMYPEVMNVPLIVHLPSWQSAHVRTDLDAVAFSSDITPSLYALLGYEPKNMGALFGRPLFTSPDGDSLWRKRQTFLLASSYGAVYGSLSRNGRRLYVVDAVDGSDYAFDVDAKRRIAITPATMTASRAWIGKELKALAAVYGVH